jgi:hypothetical protein
MRKLQYSVFALLATGVTVLAYAPPYKANPTWVQGTTTMMMLRQMEGIEVIRNKVDVSLSLPDHAAVSMILRQSGRVAEGGYGATREVIYGVNAITKSLCAEFQPGCLSVESKAIRETVSIKANF